MAGRKMLTAAMILTAVLVMSGLTEAQDSGIPSCAQKLVPCAAFMNSTSPPPATCCDPIKEAVATELQCLCNLYNTPGLLVGFGFTVDQARNLTSACGVDPDTSACDVGAQSPTSEVPPPPGVAGNGAGSMMAWTGVSTLLLSIASVMLY